MSHDHVKTAQLTHDLQVHQIELQSQNEELRRAQQALEESRARYFDLYDMAPVGYLTVAATGLILEANLSAATLLGVPRGALVKRPLSRFIVKTQQDSYYQCRRDLLATGEAQSCELQVLQSDGVALWVKLNMSAMPSPSDTPVLRITLSDIAERKHLFHALQDTNRNLEVARQQADKANQAKSEFLSSMSHELRSPLNAILGFAQLMEAGAPPPTPSQQASLTQILKGGWYLLELVNEILDLAAIESGHAALTMEPVPLAAVLLDCQTLVEPLAAARAVVLSFPELDRACSVQADPIRLKQVIINLLSNAIKYNTEAGTVEVSCSTPAPGRLRIHVRDTGEGLSTDKLAQLFQSFNRLGQETSATQGTGIGLVVCQQLVHSMGGEIGVTSTVGEGSEFWVELGLSNATPRSADPMPAPAPDNTDAAPHPVRRTVLYVEDNLANMALIAQLLATRPDVCLLRAQDARQGVAMARNLAPDVVVMDINLPDISGMDALQLLRTAPATAHIPVLALSANAMPHDVDKGLAAEFYRYVIKPIRVSEFLAALDQGLALAAKQT